MPPILVDLYSGFQIDELHHHNQNPVGTLHATSLQGFGYDNVVHQFENRYKDQLRLGVSVDSDRRYPY